MTRKASSGSVGTITLLRVYDHDDEEDRGRRFLVERLWPRGVRRDALRLEAWLPEAGPSHALRKWFAHDPDRWPEFRRRYFAELDQRPETWRPLARAVVTGDICLLYSSHDREHNNAAALRDYLLDGARKLTSTGERHRVVSVPAGLVLARLRS